MPGPMHNRALGKSTVKDGKKTFKRLFKEVFSGKAKLKLVIVLVCIVISSFVTVFVSNMIETLIDEYITPMITGRMTDFVSLGHAIIRWALIMLVGVLSVYCYSRIMVTVAQDALMNIRNKMFRKLEKLPISYYDQTQHGATMSLFTNDVDTLQQMISQSLVGVLSTAAERAPTVHAVTMTDKIASVSKVTIFFKVFPIRFNPYGHIYRTTHAARATS